MSFDFTASLITYALGILSAPFPIFPTNSLNRTNEFIPLVAGECHYSLVKASIPIPFPILW